MGAGQIDTSHTLNSMITDASAAARSAVSASFREEWGRIVATLIGATGDWDLAEECAQDAFARALPGLLRDPAPGRPAEASRRLGRDLDRDHRDRNSTIAVAIQKAFGPPVIPWLSSNSVRRTRDSFQRS